MSATPASPDPRFCPHPGPARPTAPRRLALAIAAAIVGAAPAARAAGPPLAGTTVAHRPSGGSLAGWQRDVTTSVGLGRMVTDTLAVELDVAPTFVSGSYAAFSFVPGVVWAFSPHVYAAARFVVPVDPQLDLGLYPGIGVIQSFSSLSLVAELNPFSYVGRGNPDLGVSLTAGALYAF